MLKALVAEDEMLIRELIVEDLTDAGFTVTAVDAAEEALSAIEQDGSFDLLFTDIRMPGSLDGWELGRRALELSPGLRVVYATGYSDNVQQLSARERRIAKPYRYEEVVAILRSLDLL